ncbi:dGTP triphosphohydrolase [Phycobacter sp. 'Weihai']
MIMEWGKLLNPGRLCRPDFEEKPGRPAYLQDHDRILFSEPFRRLAQKTQVHPLHDHDHVHHRMIHSMETVSVGRSLGAGVGAALEDKKRISDEQISRLSGHIQAACLMHDIGNPPFGHSGEDTIGSWFSKHFKGSGGLFEAIPESQRNEFRKFEGNAQGLRIVGRLEYGQQDGGLRLSYATLGAFMKYPCTREMHDEMKVEDEIPYVGLKKFGVFASDAPLFEEIADALGLIRESQGWCRRHPLAFLVEAADDICYRILDTEDAATMGDLQVLEVVEALEGIAGKANYMPTIPARERIGALRAVAITGAIAGAVEAFMNNYDAIMMGEFNSDLVGASSKADGFQKLEDLANTRIFVARRKTELEVSGRQILHSILDHFYMLFEDLKDCQWNQAKLEEENSHWVKLIRAVDLDLRGVQDDYTALHSLADFVSGMTDRYAVKVRDMVEGRIPAG